MQILPRSVLQVLAARLFAALSASNPHAGMPEINYSAPVGGRPLLPRGQAAARGHGGVVAAAADFVEQVGHLVAALQQVFLQEGDAIRA